MSFWIATSSVDENVVACSSLLAQKSSLNSDSLIINTPSLLDNRSKLPLFFWLAKAKASILLCKLASTHRSNDFAGSRSVIVKVVAPGAGGKNGVYEFMIELFKCAQVS